jgi:hypothetical protein
MPSARTDVYWKDWNSQESHMPNYRIREWTLSFVTTPERAAAIVGDMVEDGCSPFRCWTAIASHLAHAITPGAAGLVLTGFFAQFILSLAAWMPLSFAFHFLFRPFDITSWRAEFWCALSTFLVVQILIGYWIGRTGQRRALFLGLMVTLLDCAIGALHVRNASINMALWSIPLIAGILLYRHRLTAQTSIQLR